MDNKIIPISFDAKVEHFTHYILGLLPAFIAYDIFPDLITSGQQSNALANDDFQELVILFSVLLLVLIPMSWSLIKTIIFLCRSNTYALTWNKEKLCFADMDKKQIHQVAWQDIREIQIQTQMSSGKYGTIKEKILVLNPSDEALAINWPLEQETFDELQTFQPQIPWSTADKDLREKHPFKQILLTLLYCGLFMVGLLLLREFFMFLVYIW